MKRKNILAVLVSVLFLTPFNSVIVLAHARFNWALNGSSKSNVAGFNTIWVPDNYTTIQEAIDNASERDTIVVRAGTYYEHVVVNKALSLVGENKNDTIIGGKGTGTVVSVRANNVTLSGFTIQNGRLGIELVGSKNSILTGNTVSSIELYGIHVYHSSNNVISDNYVSNNSYGILVADSDDNILSNNYASNNSYGLYFYYSSNNVTGNYASNNEYGILVGSSDSNVLSNNYASNNSYGIYLWQSSNNVISYNYASNNNYGVYLDYSDNNVLSNNYALNNNYGIHVFYSDNNIIVHNNFIDNTEPPSSIDSVNFLDNGVEGNYWSDYNGADANWDGIGDTSYSLDENSQDNYPLIGPLSEFDAEIGNQSYTVAIVSNSTISNFQCYYDAGNQTSVVTFMVNDTEGKGFCRICVPHALIKPHYMVTIDHNPPLYNNTVRTNGTHTWLYFTYQHSEHEVMIIHVPTLLPPEQLAFWFEWWFWTIITLAVVVVILLFLSIKQKKAIQKYERELQSHLYRARALFKADVEKRRAKIEKFKKKYNIEIRTADTLEEFLKRWKFKKKVKH